MFWVYGILVPSRYALLINSLIKKCALSFPSFATTADKDSNQSWVSSGSMSPPLVTWIIDWCFSWDGFWGVTISFFFSIFSSACLIILSVSLGIGLSDEVWFNEAKFKSKSLF